MSQTVPLTETATGEPVAATLHPALTITQVITAESSWAPHRRAAHGAAEHSHWDWSLKTGLMARPGVRCLGIEYAGEMQGMVMVKEIGYSARLDPDRGRPLVYVDYLESAPWNTRAVVPVPRYRNVGRWLLAAAVVRSSKLGYDGRIGLHSLGQSEPFYEQTCGMTPVGPDPEYYGLTWFEYTARQADQYVRSLTRGG